MNRNQTRMTIQNITRMAMLTAVALALGWVEQFIPSPMPGIKLGLANTVLLYALYLLDAKSAVMLMFLKAMLASLLFAGMSALLFSFGGGIPSVLMMILVKKLGRDKISIIGVSVVGAVFHNLGQLAVAVILVGWRTVALYSPILIISGVVMGVATGIVGKYTVRALAVTGKRPAPGGKPKIDPEEPE